MKSLLALAASLVVNVALLGAIGWSVAQSQSAPHGEVTIIQLPSDAELAALADASSGREAAVL